MSLWGPALFVAGCAAFLMWWHFATERPVGTACAIVQAAALAFILARALAGGTQPAWAFATPLVAALGAGGLAWLLCRHSPHAAPAALNAGARAGVYGGMLLLFARTLRRGQEPLVTGIARRIDPRLSPRRLAYTRAVTWLWTGFFALNLLAALTMLAAAPWNLPWFAAWAGIPLAVVLFAIELAFRSFWFRGQPRGSASGMARALLRRGQQASIGPQAP